MEVINVVNKRMLRQYSQMEVEARSPNGGNIVVTKWRQKRGHQMDVINVVTKTMLRQYSQMEEEARSPNGGNKVVTKWRQKRGHQMEGIACSPKEC